MQLCIYKVYKYTSSLLHYIRTLKHFLCLFTVFLYCSRTVLPTRYFFHDFINCVDINCKLKQFHNYLEEVVSSQLKT